MSAQLLPLPAQQPDMPKVAKVPQLVFLLYVNRSGSTYLASKLAELPGVVVTLESEALRRLLLSQRPIYSRHEREACLQQLFAEPKFQQWGVPVDELRRALGEVLLPLEREQLLRIILRLLPGSGDAQCYILKIPRLMESLPNARPMLANCKVLHVVRDPRAVFASQRRSISSRTGRPMVRDALTAGLRWRRAMQLVRDARLPELLELRYEDLVTSPQTSMEDIVRFLQLDTGVKSQPNSARTDGAGYLARIPLSQRHLHTNVGKPADTSRIVQWTAELSTGDVWLLERACSGAMAKRGYLPQSTMGRVPNITDKINACAGNASAWLRDISLRLRRRVSS